HKHGILQSVGRTGVCWDNAPAESFLATLKKELVHRQVFRTRAEARLAIRHWIEAWYNRRRISSVLGYLSPIEWENNYRHTNTIAA
ncbi:MAG: IS3 family transposase, partial [Acidimicrobiia bacterium]